MLLLLVYWKFFLIFGKFIFHGINTAIHKSRVSTDAHCFFLSLFKRFQLINLDLYITSLFIRCSLLRRLEFFYFLFNISQRKGFFL